jgi:hypothetical protein
MALEPYLTVDTITDSRGPLVHFTKVNVQAVNGESRTSTANDLGNLIIAYDEQAPNRSSGQCSIGAVEEEGVQEYQPVANEEDCNLANGMTRRLRWSGIVHVQPISAY